MFNSKDCEIDFYSKTNKQKKSIKQKEHHLITNLLSSAIHHHRCRGAMRSFPFLKL